MSEAGAGIEGLRGDSAFARYVGERLTQERFKLLDVGCAGGLPSGWRTFGDRLSARGFDCNEAEVARLNAAETNADVRYEAGYVGLRDGHPLKTRIGSKAYWHIWVDKRLSYERSAHARAAAAAGAPPLGVDDYFSKVVQSQDWSPFPVGGYDTDYARTFEVYPVTDAAVEAARRENDPARTIDLPAYARAQGFEDADFLKLDIDGPDWEVLRSASELLGRPTLLGAALEVCFYGSHDANDNSFHNTDRLMREKGFDLFALSVRTYSSAALPWPYLDAHPSMTTGGRPVQGDAIYVRDLASRARKAEAEQLSAEKIAKQAAILALFRLPDYAAETLIVHRERLSGLLDVSHALDLLALEIQEDKPAPLPFRDYSAKFDAEDSRFFDVYTERNSWMQGLLTTAREAGEAKQAAVRLEEENLVLRPLPAQLEAARRRVAALEAELQAERARAAALRGSLFWRATSPLRRAAAGVRKLLR